ncbi:hypothetical protein FOVG_19866 [Fusarium oxysporum f. sp. pisi HDV247]|uniref:DUF7872 domain-containing protein n=2 Tax=Fusarium oxysporum f. sp. pisi HDV247 TaxID=1080344 RepID=W9N715_FUSOX|nr:hypothetical protein FOVG_19866 [Fusarium oxysporum f. sp. pisi HDV247]
MQLTLSILYSTALWACHVSAIPLPQSGTGADSCDSEPLTEDTWISLNIDQFLTDWTPNVTQAETNNVQALADSFGSPNFFCGIDQFCNAGQPCLPVKLPAWYALMGVQNWNNYMNNLNTAIQFASSIIGQTLPEIVSDLYPSPEDNVTPLQNVVRAITTTVGVVPFADKIAGVVQSVFTGYVGYTLSIVKAPQTDAFLQWSNVAASLADIIQAYQAGVSDGLKKVLDTPVADPGGIYEQLEGGRFLGSAQNFTQSELQAKMIDSFKTYSIGLALQAQKIFIARFSGVNPEEDSCKDAEQASNLCQNDENGVYTRYVLVKVDGKGNMDPQIDIADKIINKYGFSKEKVLVEPTKCFDKNGGKQVMDDFGDFIPIEPNTLCLYNVAVCDGSKLDECRENGANV